eukprot:TRINITY_DN3354_c0_g1_i3.p1 TRINITY_DN3354_c0_g1~~TRINITY_DN3354_c0_g1_i3.p1  ORF type:complete len:277 (-),score=84.81 TRINITY_DN3354_c0_g1_i3:56-886(-)
MQNNKCTAAALTGATGRSRHGDGIAKEPPLVNLKGSTPSACGREEKDLDSTAVAEILKRRPDVLLLGEHRKRRRGEDEGGDGRESVKWLKMAAMAGMPKAQYTLGLCFQHGWEGLERNMDSAAFWYEAAAEKGVARAMYNTALLCMPPPAGDTSHTSGQTDRDRCGRKFRFWLERASMAGHPQAKLDLAHLLLKEGRIAEALDNVHKVERKLERMKKEKSGGDHLHAGEGECLRLGVEEEEEKLGDMERELLKLRRVLALHFRTERGNRRVSPLAH